MGRRAEAVRRTGSRSYTGGRWFAVAMAAVWLAASVGIIGVGISNVRQAHEIGAHGVPAVALVVANDGYGHFDIKVQYVTVTGQVVTAVLGTRHEAYRYTVGGFVDILYDPGHPKIVAFASTGGSTARARQQVEIGVGFLVVVPALVGLITGNDRRKARRRDTRPG